MSGFWDEERQSEWETLEETLPEYDEGAQEILDEYEDDEEYEEDYEDEEETMEDYVPTGKAAYKLDKREASVLNDATVRLEQARLYDMLIKHDLFAGVKANPRALANVQRELKDYIVSRLEVLLGIREDERNKKEEPKQIVVESPFNDVEIEFLKALSYKGTKGASAQAKTKTLAATEITPLGGVKEEPQGLQPLSGPVEEEEEVVEVKPTPRTRKKRQPAKKTPAKKPRAKKTPPQKKTPSRSIKRKRRGEMTDAEAEQIAREELKAGNSGLSKHPYEMSAKELKELAKRSAKKTAGKAQPAGYIPPATSAQTEQLIYQQQMQQQSKPGGSGVNILVQKLIHDKNNK